MYGKYSKYGDLETTEKVQHFKLDGQIVKEHISNTCNIAAVH